MGAKVLVIADEDRNGVNPTFPNPPGGGLQYVPAAPQRDPCGRLQRRPVGHRHPGRAARPRRAQPLQGGRLVHGRQPHHPGPGGLLHRHAVRRHCRTSSVAEREQYLTIAVRDFLNEGDKLDQRRRDRAVLRPAGDHRRRRRPLLRPQRRPESGNTSSRRSKGLFDQCLLLADDFRQYWLGGFSRFSLGGPNIVGRHRQADQRLPRRGWPARRRKRSRRVGRLPADERGAPRRRVPAVQERWARRSTTSPAARSRRSRGTRYAGAVHQDSSYYRLTKTIAVPAGARRGPSCSSSSRSTPSRPTTT